jgi:hypothetical protein
LPQNIEHDNEETNLMSTLNTVEVNNWAGTSGQTTGSNERSEIVSKLIGKAFEAAQPNDKCVMIDHLLGSVGVLSLATIANGVFLWRRLDDVSADLWMTAAKSVPVEASDMRDLADRVQQIDAEAIDRMVEVFNALPLSTTSCVGAILADLPLRRTRRQHAD